MRDSDHLLLSSPLNRCKNGNGIIVLHVVMLALKSYPILNNIEGLKKRWRGLIHIKIQNNSDVCTQLLRFAHEILMQNKMFLIIRKRNICVQEIFAVDQKFIQWLLCGKPCARPYGYKNKYIFWGDENLLCADWTLLIFFIICTSFM